MPTTIPTAAQPCARSSWSKPRASRAVKIGAAETRMPASWDSMWFSPKVMSRNGITTWTSPIAATHGQRPRSGASASQRRASVSRTTAPSAVRMQTMAPSLKSSSATLMNMYEAPHTAAAPPIISQERRVIATEPRSLEPSAPADLLGSGHQLR